jgi:hypothetical protein
MPGRRRQALVGFGLVLAGGVADRPATAIPLFAHEYGVTCQKCHTVIPQLNPFGMAFMANGYRIRGISPGPAIPLSIRINLVDSSAYQGNGPNGAGLPKAIVDEIELFTAGLIGSRGSYLVEQYVVDGGEPGLLRDAWLDYRLNPWEAKIPISLQTGSFTLPLPVDPETFRETYQHYTLYDQTVGANPFNFFDPKVGAKLSAGSVLRGASLEIFAGPGHDRQSGLATVGTDLMGYAQDVAGPLTPSFYDYEGTRPDGTMLLDRFERTGYGLTISAGKWTSESVIQTGWDSSCLPNVGCASSGGFTQLRYAFGPRFYALGRYEGTNDPLNGFSRDGVLLVGYRPTHNSSLTVEDVVQHVPQTTNTMNLQLTVGY